jgi:DNA-binding Lrp family transcriptional regulator
MKAYVLVKARTGEVQSVCDQIRALDGVTEAHMTFGPYDVVAEVETADVAQLAVISASGIQTISGVEQTLTCLAVDV